MNSPLRISGHGNSDANIMLVADGGSDEDIRRGYALSGYPERKIRSFAKDARLQFDSFWVTALIKDRINLKDPEKNRPQLTQDYKDVLLNEINTIKPNVIVPLSELSFQYLSGLK